MADSKPNLETSIAVIENKIQTILDNQIEQKSEFREFRQDYVTKLELRSQLDSVKNTIDKDLSEVRISLNPIIMDFKDRRRDRRHMLWLIIATLITSLSALFKEYIVKIR